jgi:plasmid stability protein
VTLNLKPEIAARLKTLANAQGLSVEDYLKQLLDRELSLNPTEGVPRTRLSAEEWEREFEEWADSFPEAPPIPDEALSRENLYPDRR